MTGDAAPSRHELLDMLRSSGDEALVALRGLTDADLAKAGYENGWTRREILAHIASIEWTYPRLIEMAKASASAAAGGDEAAGEARPAGGGIDDYNARQVAKRAETAVPDLIAEFERNRAATVGAVEAADEALLTTPIRSAGGVTGSLAEVLRSVAVEHVRQHVRDITGGA